MIQNFIPGSWAEGLVQNVPASVFEQLNTFLNKESQEHTVYPTKEKIFSALDGLAPEDIKVVILGQDPYHEPGQAQGLSFSVPKGFPLPPSLRNIFKELYHDIGTYRTNGCLEDWKQQGVLLLNTVLTVRAHEANSHKGRGWETVTTEILKMVIRTNQDVVFVLWGSQAYQTFKEAYSTAGLQSYPTNIHVLRAAHPSPLSAHRGFFGSAPFSTANQILEESNRGPIHWA